MCPLWYLHHFQIVRRVHELRACSMPEKRSRTRVLQTLSTARALFQPIERARAIWTSDHIITSIASPFRPASVWRAEVARALRPHFSTAAQEPMTTDAVALHLEHPYSFHDQASLRFAIAQR